MLYARVPRLFADLELAHGDGRFARLFRMLVKTDLLVLDDWGPDRLTASQRRDLMEIVEDRHGSGSTLITTQLPLDKWHDIIGEPTFADAILDRIVHNAYRLELDGTSMRKAQSQRAGTIRDRNRRKRCGQNRRRATPEVRKRRPEMILGTQRPGRPGGSTGTSRARRRVSCRARRGARGSLLLTIGTAYRRA